MAKGKTPTKDLDEFLAAQPERGGGNGTSTAEAAVTETATTTQAADETPVGPAASGTSNADATSAPDSVPADAAIRPLGPAARRALAMKAASNSTPPVVPSLNEISDAKGEIAPESGAVGDKAPATSGYARVPPAPEGELAKQIVAATERPAPTPPVALPGRYRVSCNPSTPLAHNHIECDAKDENDAWAQFCQSNGIRETSARRHIHRIGDLTGRAADLGESILPPAPKRPAPLMVPVGA